MAKQNSNGAATRRREDGPVKFVCNITPNASRVCVAGDFNAWDPQATPMTRQDGRFETTLVLTPGEHEYKFVVDGKWLADPAAALRRSNPFGSENSVVRV